LKAHPSGNEKGTKKSLQQHEMEEKNGATAREREKCWINIYFFISLVVSFVQEKAAAATSASK
jgi:hypothetical protein